MEIGKKEQESVNDGWSTGSYRLLYPLRLREGAGLNYAVRTAEDLTEETGKKMQNDGCVRTGSVVQISEIKYLSVSVWGKTKEGWLCLCMSHTLYVEKIS